jgi:malonate transporter
MLQVLTLTIPVYLLIAIGYASVKAGMFHAADMRVLGRFVVGFCLPGLLFNALASRDLGEVLQARYLAGYAIGSVAMVLGGMWVARRLQRKPLDLAALQGLGMGQSNTGFFGYAIAAPLLGEPASVALALTMMVENLLVLPLGLALADAGASGQRGSQTFGPALRGSLRGLLRNPMIIAISAGFAFAMLGLRLPEPVARTVQLVATASSPVALFVVGGTLAGFSLRGVWRDVAFVGGAKLLLHPLAVGGMLWLLGPVDAALWTAAILFASSPMLSIYPVVAQKHGHEGLCAATLLATTAASFFTVNAVLWLLRHLPLA